MDSALHAFLLPWLHVPPSTLTAEGFKHSPGPQQGFIGGEKTHTQRTLYWTRSYRGANSSFVYTVRPGSDIQKLFCSIVYILCSWTCLKWHVGWVCPVCVCLSSVFLNLLPLSKAVTSTHPTPAGWNHISMQTDTWAPGFLFLQLWRVKGRMLWPIKDEPDSTPSVCTVGKTGCSHLQINILQSALEPIHNFYTVISRIFPFLSYLIITRITNELVGLSYSRWLFISF